MSNEVDDFLNGLENEPKDDPFVPDTKDPFNQEIDPKENSEDEKEEKPLPFNKDPKVQKFIDKEISKRLAEVKPVQNETERFVREQSKDNADEILSSLTEIVGNDTPQKINAVKRLRDALANEKQQAVQDALERIQNITQEERETERREEAEAVNELEEGFEQVEDQFGVDFSTNRKLRDEFIDFIVRVAPKDSDGQVVEYPDFQETYKLFTQVRKVPNNRAKELSNRSMNRSSDAPTSNQAKGNSWNDVDKLLSTLDR